MFLFERRKKLLHFNGKYGLFSVFNPCTIYQIYAKLANLMIISSHFFVLDGHTQWLKTAIDEINILRINPFTPNHHHNRCKSVLFADQIIVIVNKMCV